MHVNGKTVQSFVIFENEDVYHQKLDNKRFVNVNLTLLSCVTAILLIFDIVTALTKLSNFLKLLCSDIKIIFISEKIQISK